MRFVAVVLACVAVVALTAPATRASASIDATPWPSAVVRAVALGRTYAAADVAWLKTVQIIGDDEQTAHRWPALHSWIDLVTGLDPTFDEPYHLGATLLVTDPDRAAAVDALLARGERAFPTVFSLPMLRGFLAQFGTLDPPTAARHYERAARLPNAPPYLGNIARRLTQQDNDCRSVLADLALFAETANRTQAEALAEQRSVILTHCIKGVIEGAAVRFKHNNGRSATLAEVEAEVGAMPHPPGRCWILERERARLEPCP